MGPGFALVLDAVIDEKTGPIYYQELRIRVRAAVPFKTEITTEIQHETAQR